MYLVPKDSMFCTLLTYKEPFTCKPSVILCTFISNVPNLKCKLIFGQNSYYSDLCEPNIWFELLTTTHITSYEIIQCNKLVLSKDGSKMVQQQQENTKVKQLLIYEYMLSRKYIAIRRICNKPFLPPRRPFVGLTNVISNMTKCYKLLELFCNFLNHFYHLHDANYRIFLTQYPCIGLYYCPVVYRIFFLILKYFYYIFLLILIYVALPCILQPSVTYFTFVTYLKIQIDLILFFYLLAFIYSLTILFVMHRLKLSFNNKKLLLCTSVYTTNTETNHINITTYIHTSTHTYIFYTYAKAIASYTTQSIHIVTQRIGIALIIRVTIPRIPTKITIPFLYYLCNENG